MSTQAKFLEGSLFRHISVMSATASVGLMAIFLVDFVDMLFISMLGKEELAAAVGYAGAILFFTSSLGIGLSIGAGATVGRAVGAGDETLAARRASSALLFGVVISAIFAFFVWANLASLSKLVGASGPTLEMSVTYLSIIIPSLPLLAIGMIGSAILRAHGAAQKSMWVTIIGGLVNAILDPILIFGLNLELVGAAWASVDARFAIAGTAFFLIVRDHGGLQRPSAAELAEDFGPLRIIAVPAILTQLATPIGSAYVTRAMAEFGEAAVAGMAIVGRLTPVAFAVIFALSGALGPIIAQNHGAGKEDRVWAAYKEGVMFCALVVVGIAAVLFILRGPIADLFEAEGIARELVFLFCGPLALAWFFNGAIFVSNASFNNLGHPYYSTWINWGRHTLGTIPFVIACAAWFGASGVLIGQAAGGVVFGVAALWLGARVSRNPVNEAEPAKEHGHFREKLQELIHHRR